MPMPSLRQLWLAFGLLLILVLYVTLPASHRIIGEFHGHVIQRPSSSSAGGGRRSSPNNNEKSSQLHSSSSSSSASASSHHDAEHIAGDAETDEDKKQQQLLFHEQFPQMEPTQLDSIKRHGRYRNPYRPLQRSKRPCTGLKYTRGKWVRRDQPPKPVYPALGEILGCCERGFQTELLKNNSDDSRKTTATALRPELFYEWVPDECDLVPWSEELFCKALRGRDLMIAGDSLNDHWHASLYYLLGGRKDIYKREGTIAGKHRCHGHSICARYYRKPLTLHFLTNQFLAEERLRNRNYKWWKPIGKYPVLVLNSGSWMRDPADETKVVPDEKWQDFMRRALGLVHRQQYNGTIIWRTTYSGHPYCWKYTEPLSEPLAASDFPHVYPYDRYRWEFIPSRNAFTTPLWQKAGAHILDVERMTNMMPLGHLGRNHPKFATRNATDCLHYCSPGPVYDTWSELLMNLLLGNLDS